jgi:hypothetical protein
MDETGVLDVPVDFSLSLSPEFLWFPSAATATTSVFTY